jgi:hypothetical protein
MKHWLRISGILLILGLIVEALSLCWNTAASFMSFMIVGGVCFIGGVLTYLYFLLTQLPASGSPMASRSRDSRILRAPGQ